MGFEVSGGGGGVGGVGVGGHVSFSQCSRTFLERKYGKFYRMEQMASLTAVKGCTEKNFTVKGALIAMP